MQILKIMRYWTGSQCSDLRSGTECEKRGDGVTTLAKKCAHVDVSWCPLVQYCEKGNYNSQVYC